MDKKNKLIILAIVSFFVFAMTMFYIDNAAWIMVISLISFVTFQISIYLIILNVKTKSDSNT